MTETAIELHMEVTDEQWVRALGSKRKPSRQLPDWWWQKMEAIGGELYQALLQVSHDKKRPAIEGWERQGNRLELDLFAGAEGYEIAESIVPLLQRAGCRGVEAIVYGDESGTIIDDDGVAHSIGVRYFIDSCGQLAEAEYPEVEYEYYD